MAHCTSTCRFENHITYRPCVILTLLFATGIWAELTFSLSLFTASICLIVYLALLAAIREKGAVLYVSIFILGIWRLAVADRPFSMDIPNGKSLCKIRGHIVRTPIPGYWVTPNSGMQRALQDRFILQLAYTYEPGVWREVSGKVKVVCDTSGTLRHRGDYLEIVGEIEYWPTPGNPGEWNPRQYWHARGVDYLLNVAHCDNISLLQHKRGCPLLNFFSRLRVRYIAVLRDATGPSSGNFLAALALGTRELLPSEDIEKFSCTGLIHLLAISGMHIGIMAFFLWLILRWLCIPYVASCILLIVASILYSMLTDMQPPVIRATLTMCLYLAAPLFGRRSEPINCLFVAAFIILWYNPFELIQPGFQLSFAACLMIFLWPSWHRQPEQKPDHIEGEIPNKFPTMWHKFVNWCVLLRHYVAISLWISSVASLGTAPLIAYYFMMITPLAPFLTVLVLPLITFLFAGTLLLLFSPLGIGYPAALLSVSLDIGVNLMQKIMEWITYSPTHVWVLRPLCLTMVLFYLMVIYWEILRQRSWSKVALLLAYVAIFASGQCRLIGVYDCGLTVLDVGHGGAIYLKLPNCQHILYDCGSSFSPIGKRVILPFFRTRGIRSLDAIIISHADSDHYNGLGAILAHIHVRKLIVNQAALVKTSPISVLAKQYGIPLIEVKDGQVLPEMPHLHFLYPGEKLTKKHNNNEHSLLALVTLKSHRILLTGDLGPKSIKILLARELPRVDILQIPHHGSLLVGTELLLQRLRPTFALLCAREGFADNSTLHTYQSHGVKILSAWQLGATDIGYYRGKINISSFRSGKPNYRRRNNLIIY